ncbi:MAG: hypothetical protein ABDH34_08400 [Dictyoglomus thermophilum]
MQDKKPKNEPLRRQDENKPKPREDLRGIERKGITPEKKPEDNK